MATDKGLEDVPEGEFFLLVCCCCSASVFLRLRACVVAVLPAAAALVGLAIFSHFVAAVMVLVLGVGAGGGWPWPVVGRKQGGPWHHHPFLRSLSLPRLLSKKYVKKPDANMICLQDRSSLTTMRPSTLSMT